MLPTVMLLDEPFLEFRHAQRMHDPHSGLALFGPFDADLGSHPHNISYVVIGPPEGISAFTEFAKAISSPIVSYPYGSPEEGRKNHVRNLLWPPFPGYEAAFASNWNARPAWHKSLDRDQLLAGSQQPDPYRRAYDVVSAYVDALRISADRDERFHVIVCVVPDLIYKYCRPKSVVAGARPAAAPRKGRKRQSDVVTEYDHEIYEMSVDFRRQLKARAMEFKVPVQLIRESTLQLNPGDHDTRGLTALSDRAWNISTALYYKAGGKPWRLSTAREGVCYVGLAFRQAPMSEDGRTACCAAQMFLDTGDGVVFRGEFGPWYSSKTEEFHLDRHSASELLRGVLDAYYEQEGRPLSEIFLHSRSTINDVEFAGYSDACPEGVRLVGVRVRPEREGVRLYRQGKWPVMRGTLWVVSDREAYLWASGFKPSLHSYDGWEVPVPLHITIEHGRADIVQVARDILGLTKLNYNACKLGDAAPVTVGFSDAVGEILVSNPNIKHRRPNFKYYI